MTAFYMFLNWLTRLAIWTWLEGGGWSDDEIADWECQGFWGSVFS